jgi:hypothetical protein
MIFRQPWPRLAREGGRNGGGEEREREGERGRERERVSE